ncbi:MAG: ATP-binding protein [Candidatus Aenigmatarchaeota archaeon]
MKVNIRGKKVLIFGLNGTGKTTLAKYISRFYKTLVLTLNGYEWVKEDVTLLQCNAIEDFKKWLSLIINKELYKKAELIIFDDFDLFFQHHFDYDVNFQNLIYRNRHLNNISIIAITRRPQNLPSKYYEVFDILVGFRIEAPNVITKLNQIYPGLGEMVKNLDNYVFIWKEIGKEPIKAKVRL